MRVSYRFEQVGLSEPHERAYINQEFKKKKQKKKKQKNKKLTETH